ncbi:hypothetical protein CVT26_014577 [Gymnopilus dilepis]|uniref:Uncharacterized protein n=1 Tax=Gymnopilus dilepis TaxID=231916 RepID=A0A409W306_9AGAR|nr:hypothetical protein CVT26_014577 [Gymnopilus dilepis]
MATDAEPPLLPLNIDPLPATDFGAYVTRTLARSSRSSDSATIDQAVLRKCILLASSFLITDTATDPEHGMATWFAGLSRLVDLVIVLHRRNELELDTINCASKACSECWTAGGNWRVLSDCRNHVREIGGKLKRILDPNERTYRGTSLSSDSLFAYLICSRQGNVFMLHSSGSGHWNVFTS